MILIKEETTSKGRMNFIALRITEPQAKIEMKTENCKPDMGVITRLINTHYLAERYRSPH